MSVIFFFSSRRRHTRCSRDWSSDVCSSDLAAYFVKMIAGVKVAVIGVTTPLVPEWESPEHYSGYRFDPGVEAVRAALAELRDRVRPDVVVVAAHTGLDRDPQTGVVHPDDSRENFAYQIAAEVKGIDAIVFGHTHQQL